jgi:hypothetical protein
MKALENKNTIRTLKTKNSPTMKRLANTSPFLLLLVPIFIIMLLTFVTAGSDQQDENMASKGPSMKGTYTKVINSFSK